MHRTSTTAYMQKNIEARRYHSMYTKPGSGGSCWRTELWKLVMINIEVIVMPTRAGTAVRLMKKDVHETITKSVAGTSTVLPRRAGAVVA